MPRRGWVTAPDGWVQIIRGPRPPSQLWPKTVRVASAGASKPRQQIQGQAPVGRWRQSEKPRSSVPPEVSMAAAQKRVGGLEAVAALAAVGTVDGPEVQETEPSEGQTSSLGTSHHCFVESNRSVRRGHESVSRPTTPHAKVDSLGCRKLLGHRKQQFDLHKRFEQTQ